MTEDLARAYYDAIDADAYDRLADLLAAEFVHHRPDRTIAGRERFVAFMRDDRPQKDTRHEVRAVYAGPAGGVAVRGRLCDSAGDPLFEFVDAFAVENGRVAELRTYVD